MDGAVDRIRRLVSAALAAHERVVLAVSGGRDSMVLLDAAAAAARDRVALVATFDHGTGEPARRAAALVARTAGRLDVPVVTGRADRPLEGTGEAAWRDARWRFLRETAAAAGAVVATAHTRDDQVETVLMRALRGAGARGLAALYAASDVARPLLGVDRADVEAYARALRLAVADDPSNRSLAFLRNRVRLELLPALAAARPSLPGELLELSRRAADWRGEVEALAGAVDVRVGARGALHVALSGVTGYDPAALRVLWPALLARAGITLDRRGTRRIAEFTSEGASGQRIQLSGGFEVVRRRDELIVRRRVVRPAIGDEARALDGAAVRLGGWELRPLAAAGDGDPWRAELPAGRALTVRAWRPGDRMQAGGAVAARRVKRYLADARVPADRRAGWPVVLADDEIVWIPGVRRGHAATDRSGRPGLSYVCERYDHD